MGIIIAIGAIISFVLILLFYHPKTRKEEKEQNKVINLYNHLIHEYNALTLQFISLLREKQMKIILFNDESATKTLNLLADDINDEFIAMTEYMTRARDCLNRSDEAGAKYCIEQADLSKIRVSSYLEQLEKYNIVDKRNKVVKEEKRQRENVEDGSYFNGCLTKEDLDIRYKALVKVFHPDAKAGDEDTFKQIKKQYETLQKEI